MTLSARINPLAALLAQVVGGKKYTPKSCRVRGCNLEHGHDAPHSVATAKPGPAVDTKRPTLDVRGADRAAHRRQVAESRKFTKHSAGGSTTQRRGYNTAVQPKSVRHVNANVRGHVARERMAAIRRHETPEAPISFPVPSRRQQILARRAGR